MSTRPDRKDQTLTSAPAAAECHAARTAREIEDHEQAAQWADVEAGEAHLRDTDPERTHQ